MSTCGFEGLFGKNLNVGDFIVGKDGKTPIDDADYGIITPNQTLFRKEYTYYARKNETFDTYKDLSYFDMVESKAVFSAFAYKLENMDEYESYIYEKYYKFYELRMKAVEYYKKNKSYLPIGSIISERLSFRPYLFLGICSSIHKSIIYRTYSSSGAVVNPNNYLVCNDENNKLYCYIDLMPLLKYGLSIENLVNGKEKFSSFLLRNPNVFDSRFMKLSSPKTNCYYIGKTDLSDFYLHNHYNQNDIDFYGNLYGFNSGDINRYLGDYYSKDINLDNVNIKRLNELYDFNHNNTLVLLNNSSTGNYRIYLFEDIHDRSHKLKKL